jgi:hypothetical protein
VPSQPSYETNQRSVPSKSSHHGGPSAGKKVKLPTFNGKVEDWADFRQNFQAIIQLGDYPKIFKITQLKTKLPAKAGALITGLYAVALVWQSLNQRYGNRQVAMVAALSRLFQVKVPRGANHLQV